MKHTAQICSLILFSLVLHGCGGDDAGSSSVDQSPIIGGKIDRSHEAVGLVGQTASSRSRSVNWGCTGTLVGPRTVLTAAHCVTTASNRKLTASRMRFATASGVTSVSRIQIPTTYRPGSSDSWDDIALLILSKPAQETPIATADSAPRVDKSAEVVGFGVTMATAPHEGDGAGTRRYATIRIEQVSDRELIYDSSKKGACYGDSGGPILQDLGSGHVVIGVTSRGTATLCDDLDIATRVDAFRDWIKSSSPDAL
jgi:secreted trypsin-like serine protease